MKPSPQPDATRIPPEIIAVIAAAVKVTAGKDPKIVAIKPHDPTWERAGRISVLTSHKIR